MPDDLISIKLGLGGVAVIETRESEEAIEIEVEYKDEEAACPRCGHMTWQVHQRRRQRKKDVGILRKRVDLVLRKRRFRCRVCRKVFTEPDPACGPFRRTTRRLRDHLSELAEGASVRTVAIWNRVSEGLVQRSWEETHRERQNRPLPALIGMDGFCVSRPGRMWTGLWDLSRKTPIALTAGHSQAQVEGLLSSLPGADNVRAVVIDLWEPYRQAVYLTFPNASVVADKFHIVALGQNALRRAVQKREPVVLATVASTRGSTPRRAGARMLVRADGSSCGTIGGGCGEAEVLYEALEAHKDGRPRLVRVDLTNPIDGDDKICGGVMEVFLERVGPE